MSTGPIPSKAQTIEQALRALDVNFRWRSKQQLCVHLARTAPCSIQYAQQLLMTLGVSLVPDPKRDGLLRVVVPSKPAAKKTR